MFNNKVVFSVAVSMACLFTQTAVLADETSSSSHTVSTPAGTSTHKVEKSSSAEGSATKVESSHADATGATKKTYKASAGPDGAKVSATKTHSAVNADGSVSSVKQHESHAVGDAGSTHKKSTSATTTTPDGSTATEKHESTKTSAN